MNTFVLMWDPSISSYKMEQFEEELIAIDSTHFNWSVWEHEKAHDGDRFFLVRVGTGNVGIVMSGFFISDPYEGEDWSGKGRETYYMDMEPDFMVHPEKASILTADVLMKEIPEFDWTGGHSGRLLDEDAAGKLEMLWADYLYANKNLFKSENDEGVAAFYDYNFYDRYCDESFMSRLQSVQKYLIKKHGDACEICGYKNPNLADGTSDLNPFYSFFRPKVDMPYQKAEEGMHCLCEDCRYSLANYNLESFEGLKNRRHS